MTQLEPISQQYVNIQATVDSERVKVNTITYITHVRAKLVLLRTIQVHNLISTLLALVIARICETTFTAARWIY